MIDHPNRIPVDKLVDRKLYRVLSRNLTLGVWNASTNGIIGLREKFGRVYPFEEYHWDTGSDGKGSYGTANPLQELPETLPADIPMVCYLEPTCDKCGDEVYWEPDSPSGGKGKFYHRKNQSCTDCQPLSKVNTPLQEWLEEMEKKYPTPDNFAKREWIQHRKLNRQSE